MNRVRYTYLSYLLIFFNSFMVGQVNLASNDECFDAIDLGTISSYCSGPGKLSVVAATVSKEATQVCNSMNTQDGDVWYTFKTNSIGLNIRLLGSGENPVNTASRMSATLYRGRCNNLKSIGCNLGGQGKSFTELAVVDILPGETLTLRVGTKNQIKGSFELCIDGITPIKLAESDCNRAQVLCNKEAFVVPILNSVGANPDEVNNSCLDVYNSRPTDPNSENGGSVWYKWKCSKSGTLTFTLTPFGEDQDLDFAVVRLPGGVDDCNNKELLRCMAAGETEGVAEKVNAPCLGPTGLSVNSRDLIEDSGCTDILGNKNGNDNFLAPINMVQGQVYALVVNNFSNDGKGFSIKFGGTGEFEGPNFTFGVEDVSALECDKAARFTSQITAGIDSIIKYQWSFGEDATIATQNGPGPHQVEYSRFGTKTAALTVETLKGCVTTKLLDVFVKPCCKDTSTLDAAITSFDRPSCVGVNDGFINATGVKGAGDYVYSINNKTSTQRNNFNNLGPGIYEIIVTDKKGCMDSVEATIPNPIGISVSLTRDTTIELGESVLVAGSYQPSNLAYNWIIDTNSCQEIRFNPNLLSQTYKPFGTTNVILEAKTDRNCIARDTMVITTVNSNELIAPNILYTNSSDLNNLFILSGGKNEGRHISKINKLRIYDRWGNQVYIKENITLMEKTWNGKAFNNDIQEQGVFVWVAEVEFIDCTVKQIKGDVLVLN